MNIQKYMKRISNNIKVLTKWYDYKIGELEKDAGVSLGYISRISSKEESSSSMPLMNILVETSNKFKVSIDSLIYIDYSKFITEDSKRLYLFVETLLYLTDNGRMKWQINNDKDIKIDGAIGSYAVQYNKNISFYIFALETVNDEYPGFSLWVSNRDKKTNVATVTTYGPPLYEILREIFDSAGAHADSVFIDESADSAIRCFMTENGNVFDEALEQKKYKPLFDRLNGRKDDEITLTFFEIEQCLGFELPKSAYKYSSFWANNENGQHHHCLSWLNAGYKTVGISKSLIDQYVTFKKIGSVN